MSEATMLLEHGTVLARLKPVNILQAAQADLRLLERKRENKADEDARYSFHRRHVARARDAEHLVALAYYEGHVAETTDKHSTLIVYRDRGLLRQVLLELLQGDVHG